MVELLARSANEGNIAKRGHVATVKPDGWTWQPELECAPMSNFVVVKVPGEDTPDYEHLDDPEYWPDDEESLRLRRKKKPGAQGGSGGLKKWRQWRLSGELTNRIIQAQHDGVDSITATRDEVLNDLRPG